MLKKLFLIFLIIILNVPYCFAIELLASNDLIIDDSIHSQIAQRYDIDNVPELPEKLKNSTPETIFTQNEFDNPSSNSSKATDTGMENAFTPNSSSSVPTSKYNPTAATTTKTTTTNQSQTTPKTTTTATSKATTTQPKTATQPVKSTTNTLNAVTQSDKSFEAIKIKKGTKFKVVNSTQLTDALPVGTTINFVSTVAETNRFLTIPKNTVFKGVVEDSHTPNLTGNGGLLVIRVNKMVYNGGTYPISAKITIANQKKVFFNNIKGKRLYWKNVVKSTSFGKRTYDRMWAKTKKYFQPGIEIILTPFTFVTGTVVYAANIVASPVLAIFSKGGRLIIPKESQFQIKFLEDFVIYK